MTLPTGTVTFLFTDIEGSTRLLSRLGDGFAALLERHHELLRSVIEEHSGTVVRTEGDAVFAVFTSAHDAVLAAAEAQRRLADEAWAAPLSVRMGLHTGDGRLSGDDYYGIDVHRAARIAAAGHGGQVLLSEPTSSLVAPALPPSVHLRSLGSHRFKDLPEPEQVSELLVEGLRQDFPPIRSEQPVAANLPPEPTTFVGRESEIAEVGGLLSRARLVTLTGPGGTGKTRLALRVAAAIASRFPDGVFLVELAPISDPELIPSSVASALSLQPGSNPSSAVTEYLSRRQLLLVLDNFEQVLDGASWVASLLQASPTARFLVTSRAPLHVYGEQEYRVPPLEVPADADDLESLRGSEAVRLFVDRASSIDPGFTLDEGNAPPIAGIVVALDGLPLAIELAAARTRLFSPDEILRRLDSRLSFLKGGARDLPPRQQTLHGAIAWSHELLSDAMRRLLAHFSVFVGGAQLEQVEEVCEPGEFDLLEGVETLLDHSLLRRIDGGGGLRVGMLETIREFARERLTESGEEAEVARRHALAYLALAERAAPLLTSTEQLAWLDRIGLEHDNLRAAIEWAVGAGETSIAMRLASSIWRFWQRRGHLHEGRERLERVLAMPGGDPRCRARAEEAAGGVAYWQADGEALRAHYRRSLELWEEIGDEREVANALYNASIGESLYGDRRLGKRQVERALQLARKVGARKVEGDVLWGMGILAINNGDLEAAAARFEESLTLFEEVNDPFMVGWANRQLADVHLRMEAWDEAEKRLRAGLAVFLPAGDVSSVALHLRDFAVLAWARGDPARAARLIGAMMGVERITQSGISNFPLNEITQWPEIRASLGEERAAELLREGEELGLEEAVAYAVDG